MSIIKPFRGIRYQLKKGFPLADIIAPPYDVISAEQRRLLHERSPVNVIRLILGEERANDGPKANKYTRAAELFREWRREGVLIRNPSPALYRYNVSFSLKTPGGIVEKTRPGLVALLELHEYSDGRVRPHERTLAGPKQDRFQLMTHTRAHFSQVFLLYPDPQQTVDRALSDSPPKGTAAWTAEDDAGVTHTMWPVTDPAAIAAVSAHLEQNPLYIADGHHRYETGLAYRRYLREHSPLFAQGADYILAYFTPLEHPGLTIFPYHRLLHHLPKRRLSGILKRLEVHFGLERALISPIEPGAPRREFMRELMERGRGKTVFGMVDGGSGDAYYLSLKPETLARHDYGSEIELILARLDVVALEELILTDLLAIKPKDLLNERYVAYETDYDRGIEAVQRPPNQLIFLMNSTPVADVIRVADRRGIMPEKSTYFFPKLATGLVMNAMDEA